MYMYTVAYDSRKWNLTELNREEFELDIRLLLSI